MPILETNGKSILFLHVPKTGGSSIEHHLQSIGHVWLNATDTRFRGLKCSPQHLHASAIQSLLPQVSFDWAFMVVRHPVDRLVSQYKYQTRKPRWPSSLMSFSVWLRYVLARRRLNSYYRDNHFRPQHEFEGFSAEVFRLEEGIGKCIERIDQKLGLATNGTSVVWEKRSRPVNVVVSPEDRKLILDVYRTDFKRYGYDL